MVMSGLTIFLFVITCVLCLIALTGNILVLTAILKKRRLHTTSNVYVCALAFTDIYTCIVHIVKFVLKLSGTEFGSVICSLVVGLSILGCLTSLTMIEMISIDRFFAIYWPFQYRTYCTKSRAIKICLILAVLSFGLGGGLFGILFPKDDVEVCWSSKILTEAKATVITVLTSCAALQLMVMYGAMFYKAVDHQRSLSIGYFNKNAKDIRIFDIKALKTCSVVLGSFFLTWCPPLVIINLVAHTHQDHSQLLKMCLLLPALNSALNPMVYAIMRKDIRKGIRQLFNKTDQHIFTPIPCD